MVQYLKAFRGAVYAGVIAIAIAGTGRATAQEFSNCSLLTSIGFDTNTKAGQSDADGDKKSVELLARCGQQSVHVYALRMGLITPQQAPSGDQYDTGFAAFTYGREGVLGQPAWNLYWGVYGSLGVINGQALDVMYDAVDLAHGAGGMGDARRSPRSTSTRPLASLAGRLDHGVDLVSGHGATVSVTMTGFGMAGTDQVSAGGAIYLFIGKADETSFFRPTLSGMPATFNGGSGFYAGASVRAIGYDVTTDRLGTNHAQVALSTGVQYRHGPALIGFDISAQQNCEVRGCRGNPVGVARVFAGWRFGQPPRRQP
jgi:hypothetical protein